MIIQKIYSSQQEDTKIALEELEKAISGTDSLRIQLDTSLALAQKQAEEIAALKKIRKRIRTASYIELGVGLSCLVMGLFPIWADEQKNIKSLLLGVGSAGTSAGAAGFILSFYF